MSDHLVLGTRKGTLLFDREHAYDVVYRHALDARAGRVCFGTTTGNVYVSEDRGETWRCVGHNFPPVHSVRFA